MSSKKKDLESKKKRKRVVVESESDDDDSEEDLEEVCGFKTIYFLREPSLREYVVLIFCAIWLHLCSNA